MNEENLTPEERQVLQAIFMPALAPVTDKTAEAVARRTGLGLARVTAILKELQGARPRIVRRVSTPRSGIFRVALEASRDLLEPRVA